MRPKQLSVVTVLDDVFRISELREEGKYVCHHEVPSARFPGLDHRGGIIEPNRDRFLDEHMFSGFKRRDTNRFVQLYRKADVHQVDIRIGEKIFNSIVSPKRERSSIPPWGPKFLEWRSSRHQVFSGRACKSRRPRHRQPF